MRVPAARNLVAALVCAALGMTAALGGDHPTPPAAAVAKARKVLLASLEASDRERAATPAAPHGPAAHAATPDEAIELLRLHDVKIRIRGPGAKGLAGITIRAVQTRFDISAPPVVTDADGRAVVRLPKGPWLVDLATAKPDAGSIAFARVKFDADSTRVAEISLTARRIVRFCRASGEFFRPQEITLAVPDLSFHAEAVAKESGLEILTIESASIVVQAASAPGDRPGFVVRGTVPGTTAADTTLTPDGSGATLWRFHGTDSRAVRSLVRSPDALPFAFEFETTGRRDLLFAGVPTAILQLNARLGRDEYEFYAMPFPLDGTEREFTAKPPFAATVGIRHNSWARYGDRRNTVSVRVFLRDANGLIVRGTGKHSPFDVDWQETLDGAVRASGTMTSGLYARTAVIDGKAFERLKYHLHVRGPGQDSEVDVIPHTQTMEITSGKVHVKSYPELAPNVRMFAACVEDAVRAYEDTNAVRRSRVDVSLFGEMPRGTAGWGSGGGNEGWMGLPEGDIFGFTRTWLWSGLLAHELGHVHGYFHDTAERKRTMQQAGNRAGRRDAAARPGGARVPEGDRYRHVAEAITQGLVRAEADSDESPCDSPSAGEMDVNDSDGDGTPDDVEADVSATGEDEFLAWFLRAVAGVDADRQRRSSQAAWRWALTIRGFSDDEIEAAAFSFPARMSIAGLARLRGLSADDERVRDAVAVLALPDRIPAGSTRAAISARWRKRTFAADEVLAATQMAMLAEVGSRDVRVASLESLATAYFSRGDADGALGVIVAALAEARRGHAPLFEQTLAAASARWAGR